MVGNVVEQAAEIELARVSFRNAALRRRWEPAARNDHTVKRVFPSPSNKPGRGIDRANDKTGRGIDGYHFARIVQRGVEQDHVSPQSVIGDNDRVTETVVDGQILPELPGVLSEALIHVGAKDGVRAVSDLRVAVVQSQSGVGGSHPGRPSCSAIGERELAILVVRASSAGLYVNLVVIIFARAFEEETKLYRVVALNPGEAVRCVIDGAGRVRWVRPAAQCGEVGHIHRGDAVGEQLLAYRE